MDLPEATTANGSAGASLDALYAHVTGRHTCVRVNAQSRHVTETYAEALHVLTLCDMSAAR